MFHPRYAIAEIDLGALESNIAQIKTVLKASTKIMPIIKANAYGHGAVAVARKLQQIGIDILGVACVYEVIELRKAGITANIVNVDPTMLDDIDAVFEYNYRPTIFSLDIAQKISQKAVALNKIANIHIKVDTGMARVGVDYKNAAQLISQIAKLPNIKIEGLFTHFANADILDSNFTAIQLERFNNLLAQLKNLGIEIPLIHAANSAGILFWPNSHFNMVRLGLSMFGYSVEDENLPVKIKPILTLKAYISQIKKVPLNTPISYGGKFITKKESVIATLPIGYGDGYRRGLGGIQEVLIAGKRAKIIGIICMDQMMVDVTNLDNVRLGDEAILIGKQGDEEITAHEIAKNLNTISYEILSGLAPRVTRLYKTI